MSAPDPRMEELRDLVPFLAHSNPQVRLGSLDLLLGFSVEEEHLKFLHSLHLVRFTIRLIKDSEAAIAKRSLQLLVNFSTYAPMLEEMIKVGVVTSIMEHLMTNQKDPKFALMLLNNISLNFQGAVEVFQEGRPYEGLHIIRLIKWFNDTTLIKDGKDDEWARAGAILSNMTQLETFRRLLVDPKKDLLASMKNHLIGQSIERKLCVLRIIHNLANDADKHYSILNLEHNIWELAMTSVVSYNVDGAIDDEDMSFINPILQSYMKTASKTYESNNEVRKLILDTIFNLCRNAPARKYLRAINTYQILRELHQYEREVEHDAADELLTEDLIPYFILDEKDKEDKNKLRSAVVAMEMLRRQASGDSYEEVNAEDIANAALAEGTALPGFAMAEDDEDGDIVSAVKYNKKMSDLHKEEEARLEAISGGKSLPTNYGDADIFDLL